MAFMWESGLVSGSNQARMGITCGLAELTAAAGVGKTDLSGKFYGRFYDGIRGDAGGCGNRKAGIIWGNGNGNSR